MGKTFRNITVASTGDFGDKTDKIKNWVEHAGGAFVKDITTDVTHLVASKKAWKKYHPMVQAARRLKSVHVVSLDWLEDSLTMTKSRRPLNEAKYTYEKRSGKASKVTRKRSRAKKKDEPAAIDAATHERKRDSTHIDDGSAAKSPKKKKQQQQQYHSFSGSPGSRHGEKDGETEEMHCSKDERVEMTANEYEAECAEFVKEMGTNGYRPFTDSKGFMYLLTLVRKDILRNRLEKHRLKVRYASDVFPSSSSSSSSVLPTTSSTCRLPHTMSSAKYPLTNQEPQHWSSLSNEAVYKINENLRRSELVHTDCVEGHEVTAVPKAYMPSYSVANFIPSLPCCPVPLYYFPKPFPFCNYPVIASSLPQSLQPSNPNLKVHVPNPWAQSLQLFEFDPNLRSTSTTNGNGPGSITDLAAGASPEFPRTKSYACYSIYIRPGHRYVTQLAPPGSTFDFAFAMFNKFFQKRVGVSWEDRDGIRELARVKRGGKDAMALQADGTADDRLFKFFGPRVMKDNGLNLLEDGAVENIEGRLRKPSVTMLVNPTVDQPMDEVKARAMTPEGGW
ncbi:hypothetical protein PV08_08616 [Exophiala spinifera]|uniref:BRCT domain-containing protein n=1 Tax=Exophiala spinifera TaxID=91928 RepID=A0A0D2B3G2_9EURO|nr:uncharacterized protein PV08_08616 [Exophiala spinifera]KIW13428.1 hypothetical protein PV08_08616 [Exophiala spinifera]